MKAKITHEEISTARLLRYLEMIIRYGAIEITLKPHQHASVWFVTAHWPTDQELPKEPR